MDEPLLLQVLKGRASTPPPIWLMRQAGRYLPEYQEVRRRAGSFLELCYDPKLAAEVTLQPVRRYGFDAAILFSDILVVPDALGQPVAFREGEGPLLEPVASEAAIGKLSGHRLLEHLAPVFETVERVREELPSETALIGFCGAPWTVATYMVGGCGSPDQAAARLMAYREPEAFGRLVALLAEASASYLVAQIDAGAQAVQIFDSWAGNLPDGEFLKWSVEPTRAIVRRVKQAHPEVPVIGFPRGAGPRYRSYAQETGVDAVACDTSLPLAWIRDQLQPTRPVQGNLDPLALVAGGEALRQRVGDILSTLGNGPLVFNLGHGIVPETPPDNVARLVELVRRGTA